MSGIEIRDLPCIWHCLLRSDAGTQVLEQYMVPELYATVSGSPYGERQLMQARFLAAAASGGTCKQTHCGDRRSAGRNIEVCSCCVVPLWDVCWSSHDT